MRHLFAASFVAVAVAALVADPSLAAADELPSNVDHATIGAKRVETETHWYGWEALAIDAPSIGYFALKYGSDYPDAGILLPATTYALGTPIMHFVRGEIGKGIVSAVLHVGGPLIGEYIGLSTRDCGSEGDGCDTHTFNRGFLYGALAATAIEALALGWEEVPKETPKSGWSPTIGFDGTAASVGLAGFF